MSEMIDIFEELDLDMFKFYNEGFTNGLTHINFKNNEYFRIKYELDNSKCEILKSFVNDSHYIIWQNYRQIVLDDKDTELCDSVFKRIEEFYRENTILFKSADSRKRFYRRNYEKLNV